MVRSACSAIMLTMSRLRRRCTFSHPVAWSGSGIAAVGRGVRCYPVDGKLRPESEILTWIRGTDRRLASSVNQRRAFSS